MNFNENDLLREKTELLYLRISKLARAKVLLKLEFDTEDQVLFIVVFSSANLKVVHIGPKHVHIGHILVQTTPKMG